MSLDLDQRSCWPDDLRAFLVRHPRATWVGRRSADADFWLDIHEGFRRACQALAGKADDHAAGRITTAELALLSAPRLRGLLADLHGHHLVEDFQYFPALRATEPLLVRGFDALERDHGSLQADTVAALGALGALLAAVAESSGPDERDAARVAAERFVAASGRFYRRLARHLSDEEDLVIPLLLERAR